MKSWFTAVPFLALAAYASTVTPSDSSLIGCWQSGIVSSYLSDGTTREGRARCTLVYDDTTIVSTCVGPEGPFGITYAYSIVAPGEYEAEITMHSKLPQAIGSKRQYDYRVENEKLFITTYPQATSPTPLNSAVKVVSISTRDTDSCKLVE